jgi:DNA polymerase-3 subunit epsilon
VPVEQPEGGKVSGYTVVDVETTGLFPQKQDRIIEIGLVKVSDAGEVESEWCSLINPGRDVGPTHIHGITAREVLAAPSFADVASEVIAALSGRTLVAHNARFDAQFLDHEFQRSGLGTRPPTPYLCTMQLASSYLRGTSRKLRDCCRAAEVVHEDEHMALGDARAVAGLLRYYLRCCGAPVPWSSALDETRRHWWPQVSISSGVPTMRRGGTARRPDAWLDRITSSLPRNPEPSIDAYFAVLEQALLDGYLSAHEESALIEVAIDLGLHRDQVAAVHTMYLDSMAIAAWADGVVTETERAQLVGLAEMLGLPTSLVPLCLKRAEAVGRAVESDGFRLEVGDQVAFTGDLSVPRTQLEALVRDLGLVPSGVTKQTKVVVAADPDSLSGKAGKARQYGIPIVTEAAFARMVSEFRP